MKTCLWLGVLGLVLCACNGEVVEDKSSFTYDFSYTLPAGMRYKRIKIVRISDEGKYMEMPGCTAVDPMPGWGMLTHHACTVTLPVATPGEFNVLVGNGVPPDMPFFPEWELPITNIEPHLGTFTVKRDGVYANLTRVSGAASLSEYMSPPTYYAPNMWDTDSPCPKRFPARNRYNVCSFLAPEMACGRVAIAYMENFQEDVEGLPRITPPIGPLPELAGPSEKLLVAGDFSGAYGPYCLGITITNFEVRVDYRFDPNRATDPDPVLKITADEYRNRFDDLRPSGSGCSGDNCSIRYTWSGQYNIVLPNHNTLGVVCTNCTVGKGPAYTTSFTGVVKYCVGLNSCYTAQLDPVSTTVTF